jgi:outer membrane lipoprotein-sorting protein
MRTIVAAVAVLAIAATAPAAEDLHTFLAAATAATRPSAPVRADGTLTTTAPDGTVKDRIAILYRPNGDVYVELKDAGTRALLLGDGTTALLVARKGASGQAFALDGGLDTSEFTREDLRPFDLAQVTSPTIVDRREGEVTVSVTPKPSQYTLQVITFDTDKKVPLLVKDYKDTISNLVKMRRSRGFAPAAGTWLPSEIVMENFPMRATSTMALQWKPTDDLPALFDPAGMAKPSALTWPSL